MVQINILDQIGNTPLVNIGNIYLKLESMNPSGSIKDRIAKAFLQDGKYDRKRVTTVVEATSGNTGISIAMCATVFGLKAVILCPKSTSLYKRKLMKMYGASVRNGFSDIQDAMKMAEMMNNIHRNIYYPEQFSNPLNVKVQEIMALEIRKQFWNRFTCIDDEGIIYPAFDEMPDAIVTGIGTGGTLAGLYKVFPDARYYIVRAKNKPIEGITDKIETPLVPKIKNSHEVFVDLKDARKAAQWLTRMHGISCGYSAGAYYYIANMIKGRYRKVLMIVPDAGYRYL